ncbi:MAG: 1-phosphofructokinase family hexose kinase [Oscillospiraceae bacterium]|nr:1-phosphofructokinase family hexose kinase [Oscillospiraceae bacterium]MBQ5815934.1 1-phosphofructokinase family hexose kinase [Oscillospiraceae bacterium]
MNIITLTLNPAYDMHCSAPSFEAEKENFVSVLSRDAGGKGVNISRALTNNGTENTALVVLGAENAQDFEKSLKEDNINYIPVMLNGRIRENITIHPTAAPETRISFSGFKVDDSLCDIVYSALEDKVSDKTIITFTGSLPSGVNMSRVKDLLARWKKIGAKIVIDSRSFTLSDLTEIKPWLIKPNQEEISHYLKREISSFDEVVESAKELHKNGIENVMISLGSKGALLVCSEGVFTAKPPKINPVSTIGAGDSSIAGFVAAAKDGKSLADCLKNAMAFGNAACLTSGTRPPEQDSVKEALEKIEFNTL